MNSSNKRFCLPVYLDSLRDLIFFCISRHTNWRSTNPLPFNTFQRYCVDIDILNDLWCLTTDFKTVLASSTRKPEQHNVYKHSLKMYRGKKNHLSRSPGQVKFQSKEAYIFTQYPTGKWKIFSASLFFSESVQHVFMGTPCQVGLVVSVSASHTVGGEFASRPGHTKDHYKNGTNCLPAWQASQGRSLTMQPDCLKGRVVCGTVYGDMHLKDLLGSYVRVRYRIPVPDFYLVLHGLRCRKSTIMD